MEASTKERLTGALLVVLAVVIVAPEMLAGRHADTPGTPAAQDPEAGAPLQTFDVRLDQASPAAALSRGTSAEAAAQLAAVPPPVTAQTPPEPPAQAAPSAAAPGTSADETPAVRKPQAASAGSATPAPASTPTSAPASKPTSAPASKSPAAPKPAGKWWVQIGSFASGDNARKLAAKLRAAGYDIEVSRGRGNGKDLYRVRAGPVVDRSAANALQARLVAAGEKNATVVAP